MNYALSLGFTLAVLASGEGPDQDASRAGLPGVRAARSTMERSVLIVRSGIHETLSDIAPEPQLTGAPPRPLAVYPVELVRLEEVMVWQKPSPLFRRTHQWKSAHWRHAPRRTEKYRSPRRVRDDSASLWKYQPKRYRTQAESAQLWEYRPKMSWAYHSRQP